MLLLIYLAILIRQLSEGLIATVSFDRYSKEDLIEIADELLSSTLKKNVNSKQDMRLFNKILKNMESIPFPGDLKQIIKTSIAFSSEANEYDYLRKIYFALNDNKEIDIPDALFTFYDLYIIEDLEKNEIYISTQENLIL